MDIGSPADLNLKEQLFVQSLQRSLAAGEAPTSEDVLKGMNILFKKNPETFVPLLSVFSLDGKPFSLADHFAFEPFYKVLIPSKTVWKCGRQVAKSTNLAASGIMRCGSVPHLKMLYVTPRFEQIRRLSTNYVRPFIRGSLMRPILVNEECVQHVLQRSFANGSTMYFSFAFLDVDRVRGISCGFTNYDEIQDMDYDFIPIIGECMSASKPGVSVYSGTPKTLDNGIEALWQDSSKAEWVIPCFSCGHWNMATINADLHKMIGKKGVVCSKCDKLINPKKGHWYHTDAAHHPNFHGYHVPQVIMPMHYNDPVKWGELLDKRDGKGNYSQQKYLNEVLGESADMGVKLITITDIQAASVLPRNDWPTAASLLRKHRVKIMGVDWGGGGQEEVSYTTVAIGGLDDQTGRVNCYYAHRFHAGHTHDEEASELLRLFRESGCQYFCHDFGGSGSVRETLMIQAGLPMTRIIGFLYAGRAAATRDLVVYHNPVQGEVRGYWSLDKTRSLVLQAVCMKAGTIMLPEYASSKNVTHDLLALMEDKHEMPGGSDVMRIVRQPKLPDDFAHALNYMCMGIWHTEQRYPDISLIKGIKLSSKQLEWAAPANPDYGVPPRNRS